MIKQNNSDKAHIVLFIYWFALMIWQNVRSVGNRGAVDTIIKAGLIMVLILYFCSRTRFLKQYPLIASLFLGLCAVVTLVSSNAISFSSILYYLYPVFLYFIVYSVGWDTQINKKQLISLMHWVIMVVSYIVIYAIVFCRDQFTSAFTISSAYGNELCSFLVSNHEYGMYLSYGIMAIFICLEFSDNIPSWKKYLYVICITAFMVNLVLTFSRTALVSFLAMFFIYVFFCAKKSMKIMLILVIIILVLAIFLVPQLNNFVVAIVFKGGNDAGRGELSQLGFTVFKEASYFQKLFGDANVIERIEAISDHRNLHNGYIQMLVSNGVKGVAFLLLVIYSTFRENFYMNNCTKKEKNLCRIFNGFLIAAAFSMLTNTSMLFYSSIDSYFLTLFAIIIPKYVRNAIKKGTFE